MRHDPLENESMPRTWLGLKEAGKRAYERGDYEQALNLYRTALRPEYECAMISDRQVMLSNIVACRLQIGGEAQAAAAVNDAKQCIELNPSWSKGHVRLASAYSALGKSNDACNSLQTALRLDPGNQTARQMLVRELRRERTGRTPSAQPFDDGDDTRPPPQNPEYVDDEDHSRPPPQNPDYVPPPSSSSSNANANTYATSNTAGIEDIDQGWTLQDRFRYFRTQAESWYSSQSDLSRNLIKAGFIFLIIYITFGGRFGLECATSSYSSSRGPPLQGNYGDGNAYEQFYRQRASNYERPHRRTSDRYYDDYDHHSSRYEYSRGSSYDYDGGPSYQHYNTGGSWGDSALPSIALIAGLAYLCHLGGINPLHALVMLNFAGRRRHRPFGGGLYRGGGFRRRRPGAFYW